MLVVAALASGCATLTPAGAGVSVYRGQLDAPAANRSMPVGCELKSSNQPVPMTELDMEGQKDPFRVERNRAGEAGANALLVLSKVTIPRRNPDCPASSPITDCPPSFGAWYQVVVESYSCTADALQKLAEAAPPDARHGPGTLPDGLHLRVGEP
jgi:hypothetical protein